MEFIYNLRDKLLDEYIKYENEVTIDYEGCRIPAQLFPYGEKNYALYITSGLAGNYYNTGDDPYFTTKYKNYKDPFDKQFDYDFKNTNKVRYVYKYPLRLLIMFKKLSIFTRRFLVKYNKRTRRNKFDKFTVDGMMTHDGTKVVLIKNQ